MEIYYINKKEFLKKNDEAILNTFSDDKNFKSEKRFLQHSIGRYLVKSAAKKFYKITDTEITIKNNKPVFKKNSIKFSISHSKDIVAAAFDTSECGLDIEEIKPRNLEALSRRYEKDFDTLEDFYKFWTEYEAEIKLQQKTQGKYTCVFQNNYMLTVASASPISSPPSCINFLDA